MAAVLLSAAFPLVSRAAAPAGHSKSADAGLEISGWIPYWRTATGTADVVPHMARFKEISPFGYTVMHDGTLADTAK
ncbi:MAG: hypothetical protein HY221_02300, partial [Candidatus Sungbacteria bacterium]|nr:hypothetical protein [Candidatus Sungbacteria bacterium]